MTMVRLEPAAPRSRVKHSATALPQIVWYIYISPVKNKNDLELDFKVFFFTDSCCSDIVHDESN